MKTKNKGRHTLRLVPQNASCELLGGQIPVTSPLVLTFEGTTCRDSSHGLVPSVCRPVRPPRLQQLDVIPHTISHTVSEGAVQHAHSSILLQPVYFEAQGEW